MSPKRKVYICKNNAVQRRLQKQNCLFHARPLHFLAKKDRISASLGFSAYQKG